MEATDIAGQIVRTFESVVANGEAVQRFAEETESEINRLWKDNAELRDELHALANRVETLTRARLTEPAEVAERIIPTNTPHKDHLEGVVERFRGEQS